MASQMENIYTPSFLADLPKEILLDIFVHLDLGSITRLSLVNREFRQLYEQKRLSILLPVLMRDFEPFDEFLQLYTATAEDLVVKRGIYKPRRVVFKRFFGDSGIVLSPAGTSKDASPAANTKAGFTEVGKSGKANGGNSPWASTVVLTERDLDPMLKKLLVMQRWYELFPQMRWMYTPEDCRMLRPHESTRFRKAFYRWWLYGIYFHGQLPRPREGLPEPHLEDIRISMLRYYSTTELLELLDLVQTMKDVIMNYIYPRLNPQFYRTSAPSDSDRVFHMLHGNSDSTTTGRIIRTYAKLGPEDLLHYFENIYSYPLKRLITDIHLRMPNFTMDQESIHCAIKSALAERHMGNGLDAAQLSRPGSEGGIIDFDDERDEVRNQLKTDDGISNGLVTPMHSRRFGYSPRGDDGSQHHDEYLLQLEYERPSRGARRSSLTVTMT